MILKRLTLGVAQGIVGQRVHELHAEVQKALVSNKAAIALLLAVCVSGLHAVDIPVRAAIVADLAFLDEAFHRLDLFLSRW